MANKPRKPEQNTRLPEQTEARRPDAGGTSDLPTAWPDRHIVQEVLAQITWYHNIALLDKLDDPEVRLWYARKASEEGWSRDSKLCKPNRSSWGM